MMPVVRATRAAMAVPAVLVATGLWVLAAAGPVGAVTYAAVNGQGSTYAALAFQQWTQAEQLQGLDVNYTATGSPAGLQAYEEGTATFAGSEAEYSELYADTPGTANAKVARGFAYTPDVAGAIAIMYHVALNPTGSDPVDYLQLSRLTVARIFMGLIDNWDSPTITADNKGLVLPNRPIILDYRSGASGTTALFYDFVKNTDPTQFQAWATANHFPTNARIWEVDDGQGGFPPTDANGFPGSTQQAEAVAGPQGLWSIGYDEFGYAKVYKDSVAWIENASGDWVQPYALNIAAALKTAVLAPDTSQTLKGVYSSTTPLTYPISAYSYILYQCAPTPARPTCKKPYVNPGVEATMARFMRYIACTGQIKMATIGYSPLPPELSQFMANAIGYMTGGTPATLTATNCANPQFKGGNLGVGALPPPNPVATITSEAPPGAGPTASSGAKATGAKAAAGGKGATAAAGTTTAAAASSGAASATATTAPVTGLASPTGQSGAKASANWSSPAPIAYVGPPVGSGAPWPLLALFVLLAVPAALLTWGVRRRRAANQAVGEAVSSDPQHSGQRTEHPWASRRPF